MDNPFSIISKVQITDGLTDFTLQSSWLLLGAIAVLAYLFTVVRTAVIGEGRDMVRFGLRLLLIVGLLGSYHAVFDAVLGASDGLSSHFIDHAGFHEFTQHISEQFQPLFEDENVNAAEAAGEDNRPIEPSIWDRLVGWMRGGILTQVTFMTYYLVFMFYQLVRDLAAVCMGLLRVFGPFLIAGGVFADGKSMRQWFGALVQVALWPVLPPFMMMVIVGTSGFAAQTGNTAFVCSQNVALTILTALTPLLVAFVIGRGGIVALAGAITAAKAAAVVGGVKAIAAQVKPRSGTGQASAGAGPTTTPEQDGAAGVRRPGETQRNQRDTTSRRLHIGTLPDPNRFGRPVELHHSPRGPGPEVGGTTLEGALPRSGPSGGLGDVVQPTGPGRGPTQLRVRDDFGRPAVGVRPRPEPVVDGPSTPQELQAAAAAVIARAEGHKGAGRRRSAKRPGELQSGLGEEPPKKTTHVARRPGNKVRNR